MKTLKIILHTGELNHKTNKKTARSAFEEWVSKIESLGLYDIPIIQDFIKAENAHLLDENGSIIDSLHDVEPINKNGVVKESSSHMTTKEKFLKDLEDFNFDLAVNCLPRKGFEIYDYSHIKEELEYCVEYEYWNSAKIYADALADTKGTASSYFIIVPDNFLHPSLPSYYIINTKDDVLNFIDKMEI